MREYDIYLPVASGHKRKLEKLKRKLARQFRGLTFFPHKNEGVWKLGGVTFKDDVVILRVMASEGKPAERFLRRIKIEIARDFDQQEVLIIARTVRTL